MVLKTPQIIISIQFITVNFECALKSVHRAKPTAVFHIKLNRQKYSLTTSVFGDSYGPPAETHTKWKNILERDFEISIKAPFNKSERKLDNELYDRFG